MLKKDFASKYFLEVLRKSNVRRYLKVAIPKIPKISQEKIFWSAALVKL